MLLKSLESGLKTPLILSVLGGAPRMDLYGGFEGNVLAGVDDISAE